MLKAQQVRTKTTCTTWLLNLTMLLSLLAFSGTLVRDASTELRLTKTELVVRADVRVKRTASFQQHLESSGLHHFNRDYYSECTQYILRFQNNVVKVKTAAFNRLEFLNTKGYRLPQSNKIPTAEEPSTSING